MCRVRMSIMAIIAVAAVPLLLLLLLTTITMFDGIDAMKFASLAVPSSSSSTLSHQLYPIGVPNHQTRAHSFGRASSSSTSSNLSFKTKASFDHDASTGLTNTEQHNQHQQHLLHQQQFHQQQKLVDVMRKLQPKSSSDNEAWKRRNENFTNGQRKLPNVTDMPLLIICGSTGTGKSDLAIAVAKALGHNAAEVISADSMQIYKGLDIASNKVTAEEMDGVPHHLMSFLEPTDRQLYTEWDFRRDALKAMEKIWKNGRIPIVVGGSARYIEALIFDKQRPKKPKTTISQEQLFRMFPSDEALYAKLEEVDPETAKEVFKDDIARIVRELQSYYSEEMKTESGLARERGIHAELRTRNTFVLYLDKENREAQKSGLDTRVDKMIERGLLKELLTFYSLYKHEIAEWPFGAMQTIGLVAFLPYLKLSDAEKAVQYHNGLETLNQCKQEFQRQDNNYAKQQSSAFETKILGAGQLKQTNKMVTLNMSSDVEREVVPFAVELVKTFLSGEEEEKKDEEMRVLLNQHPNLLMKSEKPDEPKN